MSLLRSMGFQKKIMLSFLVMMLLIGVIAVLFSYQLTKITREETALTQQVMPQTSTLLEVKNQLYTKTFALKMYISTREEEYLNAYYTQFIRNSLFQEIDQTEDNRELFSVIELIDDLDDIFLNQIDPLLKAGNVTAVTYVLNEEVEPRITQLEQKLSLSLRQIERQINEEFQRSNRSLKVSLIVTYTVSVVSILFGLFCTLYFRRELLRPIQSLIAQVRDVSQGTFGQQITYEVNDEFRELAREFNRMSSNIARLFQQVQEQNRILQAEKLLREQILDSLPVAVITRHFPTSHIHINEKAKELVKLDDQAFPLSPDEHNWLPAPNGGEKGKQWFENRKMTLYRQDGSTFPALVSYVPLLDQQREEMGWMVVLNDITEQEKLQEYMLQTEKLSLAGQLAAGAAHEIRNPLAVIYGFIQLMQQKMPEADLNAYHLPLILQEIERVNKIVTELLILSKPSRPDYREVSLGELFASILPLIKGEATLHGIRTVERYDPEIRLHVDTEQLKQILLNLMKNSIEAMPDGGMLTIESREDGGYVHLTISDTGTGIPEEHLPRIFEPFFSMKEEGTGLGLPISMRMVKNHGGDMTVHSEAGKGTRITVSLPILPSRPVCV